MLRSHGVFQKKNSNIALLDSNENSQNVTFIVNVYDAFSCVLTFKNFH